MVRATQKAPGRGRPRTITAAEIQDVAFAMFRRNGYVETSVDDIAAALGIGRSTFFRYFPSKSSVVWREYSLSQELLTDTLAATSPDVPMLAAIREALVSAIQFEERDREILRLRYQLIDRTPDLFRDNAAVTARWAQVIAEFVSGRIGISQPANASAIAYAFVGAASAATQLWIDGRDASFESLLTEGLQMVASAMQDALASDGVTPAEHGS